MAKHDRTAELNKGELKNVDRIRPTLDRISGRRKVRIDDKTEIYTRFATDEEAIANYNRVHNIPQGGF